MNTGAVISAGWKIQPAGRRLFRLLLALVLVVAGSAGWAMDITTTDGKTYHQCQIDKVEQDALRIMHADGAARIPYEKLPENLQKQYFDPAKVAAFRQQFAIQQQAAAAKAAEAERVREVAAAKAAEEQRARFAELQRQAEQHRAAAQAEEELRTAARKHKAQLATALMAVACVLMVFLYFLPTIIARHKSNALAIFVFNLFFGWSGIGWIAALVWACTKDSAMDMLARHHLNRMSNQPPPPSPSGGQYVGNQLPNPGQGQLSNGQQLPDGNNRYLP